MQIQTLEVSLNKGEHIVVIPCVEMGGEDSILVNKYDIEDLLDEIKEKIAKKKISYAFHKHSIPRRVENDK